MLLWGLGKLHKTHLPYTVQKTQKTEGSLNIVSNAKIAFGNNSRFLAISPLLMSSPMLLCLIVNTAFEQGASTAQKFDSQKLVIKYFTFGTVNQVTIMVIVTKTANFRPNS